MTYIENIFLCLAIPMILSLFFIRGRSRSYTLFVTIGMGICLLSAYVNSFFMWLYGVDGTSNRSYPKPAHLVTLPKRS